MVKKAPQSFVYQGQDLIEGGFHFNLDELRLLYLAISKISDSRKPQPKGTYTIYPEEFAKMFNTNPSNAHRQLKAAVNSLGVNPVFTYEWSEDLQRLEQVKRFWFSEIRYAARGESSDVTVRFSDQVTPYLYELKEKFTRMNVNVIANLETPFAYRLYSWLISYKELKKNKTANGLIVTDPISVQWMRERSGLVSKTYEEYRFFRRDVLEPAIRQINKKADITINEDFDVIKKGRSITDIVFSYIVEELPDGAFVTPTRPRLPRRPHVTANSDQEGVWARTCLDLMKAFKAQCDARKGVKGLATADIKKMIGWYKIIGDKANARLLQDQLDEKAKKTKKAKDKKEQKIKESQANLDAKFGGFDE